DCPSRAESLLHYSVVAGASPITSSLVLFSDGLLSWGQDCMEADEVPPFVTVYLVFDHDSMDGSMGSDYIAAAYLSESDAQADVVARNEESRQRWVGIVGPARERETWCWKRARMSPLQVRQEEGQRLDGRSQSRSLTRTCAMSMEATPTGLITIVAVVTDAVVVERRSISPRSRTSSNVPSLPPWRCRHGRLD